MELSGRRVVVTGVIAGESRATAETKLREAGAIVQSAVSASTDVLVVGAKVGRVKTDKARELGVAVVDWADLWSTSVPVMVISDEGVQPGVITGNTVTVARQVGAMLASNGDVPSGDDWVFEVKWDGYRCIATVIDGQVTMQSRAGTTQYGQQFPHLAKQLAGLPNCIVDGEICVLDQAGHSSFGDLIKANGNAAFVLFDLIELDGHDLRGTPWSVRREALDFLMNANPLKSVSVSPSFADGESLLQMCRDQGLEGLVAKRRSSRYQEGKRSSEWIKVKVRNEQEFVVVGWRPGEGKRAGAAGSLLLAVNDDGELVYTGSVGTGGDYNLWESFTRIASTDDPAIPATLFGPTERKTITWVKPLVVVQVQFQRWTADGCLWHPALLGIRTDKKASEVRREA
jgi:bifunctional non-homologous end joining protein LigD